VTGASDAHVTIAGNVFVALRTHVRGTPCRVYFADMKARVEPANAFLYPDVMAGCDPREREDNYFKRHPVLIVEVLSESTGAMTEARSSPSTAKFQRCESMCSSTHSDAP
jgi:Uma2 family endonuclease